MIRERSQHVHDISSYDENSNDKVQYQFAILNKDSEQIYCVWSHNKDDVVMFINQHGFDSRAINNIEIVGEKPLAGKDKLREYVFKSNLTGEEFHIMTSSDILSGVFEYIDGSLEEVSIMGNFITKFGIPIVNIINELIFGLPYAQVSDHLIVDDSDEMDVSYDDIKDSLKYIKIFINDPNNNYCSALPSTDITDLEYIMSNGPLQTYQGDAFTQCLEDIIKDDIYKHKKTIMPITIEAYINALVTCVFN